MIISDMRIVTIITFSITTTNPTCPLLLSSVSMIGIAECGARLSTHEGCTTHTPTATTTAASTILSS